MSRGSCATRIAVYLMTFLIVTVAWAAHSTAGRGLCWEAAGRVCTQRAWLPGPGSGWRWVCLGGWPASGSPGGLSHTDAFTGTWPQQHAPGLDDDGVLGTALRKSILRTPGEPGPGLW